MKKSLRRILFGQAGVAVPAIDPYWANVAMYLPLSADFYDVSANAATVNPTISAAGSTPPTIAANFPLFGQNTAHFPGGGANAALIYATCATAKPYTVEYFFYPTVAAGGFEVVERWNGTDHGNAAWKYPTATKFQRSFGSGIAVVTADLAANVWHFIAGCFENDNASRLYVDGALIGSVAGADPPASSQIEWGGAHDLACLNGAMAHIRVTSGISRYTGASCPVPTGPFPIG